MIPKETQYAIWKGNSITISVEKEDVTHSVKPGVRKSVYTIKNNNMSVLCLTDSEGCVNNPDRRHFVPLTEWWIFYFQSNNTNFCKLGCIH